MSSARQVAWTVALGLALSACGKTNSGSEPAGSASGSHSGGASTGGGATSTAGSGSGPSAEACTDDPLGTGPAPLGRLGNDQLNHTFIALAPNSSAETLPQLPESDFENNPEVPFNLDTLRGVHALAQAVALRLTEDTSSSGWLAGCDVAAKGEAACREELAKPFLERVYRRPPTAEDLSDMADVFDAGKKIGGDFKDGMRAVAEVALQGPEFLYLLELGNGQAQGGATQLTGYETAARLAYFLTRSPPDEALTAVAARGPLSAEDVEEQARRLLSSSEGRVALSRYYGSTLALGGSWGRQFDEESGLTAALVETATEASQRFIEDALFEDVPALDALLTDSSVWTEGTLGNFYGYPVEGTQWQKLKLDPARAAGVLTQPAFFMGTSHGSRVSSVQRGVRVLTRVLCEQLPAPPDGATVSLPPPRPSPATGRQLLEEELAPVPCADCHRDISPLGFAFEHYDAVGKWRELDNGLPIDSSAMLEREDIQGSFSGASELMTLLSSSDTVKQCFVKNWLKAGYGRAVGEADECRVQQLAEAWSESGERAVDLLVNIAQTPRFRYRPTAELAP